VFVFLWRPLPTVVAQPRALSHILYLSALARISCPSRGRSWTESNGAAIRQQSQPGANGACLERGGRESQWLKDNSMQCPSRGVATQKSMGCNRVSFQSSLSRPSDETYSEHPPRCHALRSLPDSFLLSERSEPPCVSTLPTLQRPVIASADSLRGATGISGTISNRSSQYADNNNNKSTSGNYNDNTRVLEISNNRHFHTLRLRRPRPRSIHLRRDTRCWGSNQEVTSCLLAISIHQPYG